MVLLIKYIYQKENLYEINILIKNCFRRNVLSLRFDMINMIQVFEIVWCSMIIIYLLFWILIVKIKNVNKYIKVIFFEKIEWNS